MLRNMIDNLIGEFKVYPTSLAMWNALKNEFGGTSATRLWGLTMKFDSYKMHSGHSMKQHLRVMSTMIHELKTAGNNLTDDQQIQAVIRSLPNSWEAMSQNLTHNEHITTFDDVARHLELEVKLLEAIKPDSLSYITESSSLKVFRPKRKNSNFSPIQGATNGSAPKKAEIFKCRRGKYIGKKDKSKMICYNCKKEGHFVRECTELKKVFFEDSRFVYVTSHVLVVDPSLMCTVDSVATKHIAQDRVGYVEYRRISTGSRDIKVRNGESVQMLGIGTYKLNLRGGCTLLLHDVLYAPEVRWNLLSIVALMRFGVHLFFRIMVFRFIWEQYIMNMAFISSGFMVLDLDYYDDSFVYLTSSDNVNIIT